MTTNQVRVCFCCVRYHLRDVIIGSVHFLLASADIDKVAVQIVRRETTNKPGLRDTLQLVMTRYYTPDIIVHIGLYK